MNWESGRKRDDFAEERSHLSVTIGMPSAMAWRSFIVLLSVPSLTLQGVSGVEGTNKEFGRLPGPLTIVCCSRR